MKKGIKDKDIRDFEKHANKLADLVEHIREYCPEANYYLAYDRLHLMNGEPHKGIGTSCPENSVTDVHIPYSGGGDW